MPILVTLAVYAAVLAVVFGIWAFALRIIARLACLEDIHWSPAVTVVVLGATASEGALWALSGVLDGVLALLATLLVGFFAWGLAIALATGIAIRRNLLISLAMTVLTVPFVYALDHGAVGWVMGLAASVAAAS
jgi:hypothetical protein